MKRSSGGYGYGVLVASFFSSESYGVDISTVCVSMFRWRNIAFRWRADDGLLLQVALFGSSQSS